MHVENIVYTQNPGPELRVYLEGKHYSKVVVLADTHTLMHCYPLIQDALPEHALIEVPAGEENKNIGTASSIWESLSGMELDRHSAMVILGGGVLGDMGGFCAATYKRGIDFVLVPTTLLSQVDSSIGGKLGIDFLHYKNQIGVFQLPAMTLLYSGFLKTLPKRELRSGFAEVIKHVLISDEALWEDIRTKDLEGQDWDKLVGHSVAFKARVTREDPREKGLRKILNTGHTIGHALESYFLERGNRILHGEAIAIGMVCEGHIAYRRKMLDKKTLEGIGEFILRVYGKMDMPELQMEVVEKLMRQDKKNKDNTIRCVLMEGIGKPRWDCEILFDEVREAIQYYQSL